MAALGRPTLYCEEMVLKILSLATKGKTDSQIAKAVKITVETIQDWKRDKPDFSAALKKAKEISDDQVEQSLRQRALGCKTKAIKFFCHEGVIVSQEYIEHHPPDVGACIFWLKNRRPDRWRERPKDEAYDEFKRMAFADLVKLTKEEMKKLEAKDVTPVLEEKK